MEIKQDPEFLNLDLEVESTSDLTDLANYLEGPLFVLYNGEIGKGLYHLSFEIDPRKELPHSPESYAEYMVSCLQSLTPDLRALWDRAETRHFDFGFGSGNLPPAFPAQEERTLNLYRTELSPRLSAHIGGLNASIKITIYPYQPSA